MKRTLSLSKKDFRYVKKLLENRLDVIDVKFRKLSKNEFVEVNKTSTDLIIEGMDVQLILNKMKKANKKAKALENKSTKPTKEETNGKD